MIRDLISLSAFPKSGVTYLNFLLFHSLFGEDSDVHALERRYVIDIHAHPEARFAVPGAPRLVKSHFPYDPGLPPVARTAKAVYLVRDPIDVMMSAWDYAHYVRADGAPQGDPDADPAFRPFVGMWLETGGGGFDVAGTWVEHVRSWLDQGTVPVHRVSYRDLVDHPARELAAILAFLGLEVPAERQALAVERSSMAAMAALEAQEVQAGRDGVFFHPELAAGYGCGRRFVNKGYRDCYRTVLTDAERALADRTFGPVLRACFPQDVQQDG
jgi:hypothetical protein